MRIGLDLDGVLLDGRDLMLRELGDIAEKSVTWDDFYFGCPRIDPLGCGLSEYQLIIELEKRQFFHKTPIYEGAGEVVQEVIEEGHEIFAVTSRPFYLYFPTQRILIEGGLEQVPLWHDGNKSGIANELKLDLFLDDDPRAVEDIWDNSKTTGLLVNRPWNLQYATWVPRFELIWDSRFKNLLYNVMWRQKCLKKNM